MNKYISVLLILWGTSPALGGEEIQMDKYYQKMNQWCWAAVSQTIRDNNRGTYRWQCKMASSLIADSENSEYCCTGANRTASSSRESSCNQPFYLERALDWNNVFENKIEGEYNHAFISWQIDQNEPVAVRVGWDRGGGHFIILYGYDEIWGNPQMYHVWDPTAGSSFVPRHQVSRYRNAGDWTHSYSTE